MDSEGILTQEQEEAVRLIVENEMREAGEKRMSYPVVIQEAPYGAMFGSTSLDKFAAALAKAQGSFEAPKKTKCVVVKGDRGDFTYYYADLADCLGMALPILSKNGLSVMQSVSNNSSGLSVDTTILHESGQYLRGSMSMSIAEGRMSAAQKIGATITYLRRYHLTAMLGIASEEDSDDNTGDGAGFRDHSGDKQGKKKTDKKPEGKNVPPEDSQDDKNPDTEVARKLEQEKRNFLISEIKDAMKCPAVTDEMLANVKKQMEKKPSTAELESMEKFWKEFAEKHKKPEAEDPSGKIEQGEEKPVVLMDPAAVNMLVVEAEKTGIKKEDLSDAVAKKWPYTAEKGLSSLTNEDFVLLWEAVKNRAKFDELMAGVGADELFNSLGEGR